MIDALIWLGRERIKRSPQAGGNAFIIGIRAFRAVS
jgi:hypothetical protein